MLRELIEYIKWLQEGKPMITYEGFHCGLCGRWEDEEFSIPKYKSDGEWWDTWGICSQCIKEYEENKESNNDNRIHARQ